MTWKLENEEIRIIGALMEKQMATPDYYPLSLNALVQACNQKSSRSPVVSYGEDMVKRYVTNLYNKGIVSSLTAQDRRIIRYGQRLSNLQNCSDPETAILCVLFLRGPQTPGEIKGRTGRLHAFESLTEVNETLDGMINREEFALVRQLARQPGRKENRFMHEFGDTEVQVDGDDISETIEQPVHQTVHLDEPDLRAEIAQLKSELHDLRVAFQEFKDQF